MGHKKHPYILTQKNLHLFLAEETVHCLDSVFHRNPLVHTDVAFYTHIEISDLLSMLFFQ